MSMEVPASDYLHKVNENATFKVSVVAEVLETGQLVTWDDEFRLLKPEMGIEVQVMLVAKIIFVALNFSSTEKCKFTDCGPTGPLFNI